MTKKQLAIFQVVALFTIVVALHQADLKLAQYFSAIILLPAIFSMFYPIPKLLLGTRGKSLAVVLAILFALGIGPLVPGHTYPTDNATPSDGVTPRSRNDVIISTMWVTSDRLNRRTCPSINCGVLGQFFHREQLDIFEREGIWARVSKYYNASCVSGRSEYVDAGPADCTDENGIVDGQVAEWVSADYLSRTEPADPAGTATVSEQIIRLSDDFSRYRVQFLAAATSLIEAGTCTEGDFVENGGWIKSSTQRNRPVYFTYCGGSTVANRIYLNADSGETFR